jgi:hypothetical protein
MAISPENLNELRELIAALREEQLTPDQAQRLVTLLRADGEARRVYIQYMALQEDVRYAIAGEQLAREVGVSFEKFLETSGSSPEAAPAEGERSADSLAAIAALQRLDRGSSKVEVTPARATELRIHTKESFFTAPRFANWRIAAIWLFIATAVFALTSPTWMGWWRSTPIATLADAVDAQWGSTSSGLGLDVGDALPRGPLFLKAGYVSIRLHNGVNLVVQGPAHFSVDSLMLAHLDQGKLTADVPHAATGYSVRIPSGMVTDIGTTFGVTAYLNHEATVQVLKGKVQAKLLADDGSTKVKTELTDNRAAAFNPANGTLANIATTPDEYVTDIRRIPAVRPVSLALHSTGQGLKPGNSDPYWKIIANSDDAKWTPKPAIVTVPYHETWGLGSATSQWLGTKYPEEIVTPGRRLHFATTVDLTGFDPNSVRLHLTIFVDNEISAVRVNGRATPIKFGNPMYSLKGRQFDLTDGFIAGENTLEFVVVNEAFHAPQKKGEGLRVELSGTGVRQTGGGSR